MDARCEDFHVCPVRFRIILSILLRDKGDSYLVFLWVVACMRHSLLALLFESLVGYVL